MQNMVKVAVIKCEDYDSDVLTAVKQVLKNADIKIPSSKRILIKPNCLGPYPPEKAITTHPAVVKAVIEILKEKGCEVSIGESSGFIHQYTTKDVLRESGIEQAAKETGTELLIFEKEKIKNTNIKDQTVGLPACLNKFDVIVNIAKLKTHELTKYTGAVKNVFGFVVGARKPYLHSVFSSPQEFSEMLLDLYEKITPQINMIDGIVGLEGDGPGTGGVPKQTGLLFASSNAIALDIVASRTIGFEPLEILTNKIGVERKLLDERITVIGDKITVEYKKPKTAAVSIPPFLLRFLFKQYTRYPFIVSSKCTKCRACEEVCPQKTIKNFVIGKRSCITCYCCSEFCPNNAIEFRMSRTGTMLLKIMAVRRKALNYLSRMLK